MKISNADYQRNWRNNNLERCKNYSRNYYKANKEKVLLRIKRNYEMRSSEDKLEYNRRRYFRLKDSIKHKQHVKRKLNRAWELTRHCIARAKKKNYTCDLDREWAENKWTGICELTNIKFNLDANHPSTYSPSIDRIDNTKGYVKDNCRFILQGLNAMKGQGLDEDLYVIAENLLERKKK